MDDAWHEVEALLAAAPGAVRLGPAGPARPPGVARSYLGDGRCVSWLPGLSPAGLRVAVDAELATRPVPAALARRHGTGDPEAFWARWTAVEVSCKLRDVPVAVWLRTAGLHPDAAVGLRTFRRDGVVITCGVVPTRG